MDIAYGRVRVRAKTKRSEAIHRDELGRQRSTQQAADCAICQRPIGRDNASLGCTQQNNCSAIYHMVCLAVAFLEPGEYVPVRGECPRCRTELLWGQLIRQANGCVDLERGGTAADCAASGAETWSDVEDGVEADDGGDD